MPSRDFSKKHEDVWFTIDPDRYDCYPVIPLDDLKNFAEIIGGGVTVANVLEKITQVMQLLMVPESFERFQARMKDRRDPIDPRQLMDIAEWLGEVYTNRPSQPPSNSSNGSPTGGAGSSSTAGAPDVVSIQANWTAGDLPTWPTTGS